MSVKKALTIRRKRLESRLTGISTPLIGLSWVPPTEERDVAGQLLTFLEDRRALYQAYNVEVGDYVVRSVLEIRERLPHDLDGIDRSSRLSQNLRAMRAACRAFLDKTQRPPEHRYYVDQEFITALRELRALVGVHVARIASDYELSVGKELQSILPPEVGAD